jgi:hypothetical protein
MPEGGKITMIDQGTVMRAGGTLRTRIDGMLDRWFGPNQPLVPVAPESIKGRQFDFPAGSNLQYQPRSGYAVGFGELRSLADALPLLRLAIETRKDQIQNVNWTIRAKDKKVRGEAQTDTRVKAIRQFFNRPDREHDFSTWVRMLMEEMLVTDAACIYPRFTRGGDVYSLDLVDGATIKRLIGEDGRTPEPPNPAYQQVLKGVVAADFHRDELLYLPRNVRVNQFYGFSPVEQIVMTVSIALRRDVHTLNYYQEGSVPDSIAALPKEWTIDQVKKFQEYWDFLLTGNSAQLRKMRFVPGGSEFNLKETKQPPLKDQYDEWLARIICWALSVAVSPLVSQVNRATGETMRIQATEEGLFPGLLWTASFLNRIIEHYFQAPDLEFAWETIGKEDPLKLAQRDQIDVNTGIRTIDEVREDRGQEGYGIDQPFTMTPTGPILL